MVVKPLTISQLNKIGDRLRKDTAKEDDLRLLDQYRFSFQPTYEKVFGELTRLGLNPGGRSHKTVLSIVAKLNREKTRLSRMQDIAGCRVVIGNLMDQDRVVAELKALWPDAEVDDKRTKPRNGYRAVHVIAIIEDHPVEIQVRTHLQHSWATATEKLADIFDPNIKYGGGPEKVQDLLARTSQLFTRFETTEIEHMRLLSQFQTAPVLQQRDLEWNKFREEADAWLQKICEDLNI